MNENLKYPTSVYICNEFPDNEKLINGVLVLYNELIRRKVINSFEEFVRQWRVLPKTRRNFSQGNFKVSI